MAVCAESSSKPKEKKEKKRRSKAPGVRVVGRRIYDSERGKSCHQCRQKTMDFVAVCKNTMNDKPCTLKYCHTCLLNRYGEIATEVDKREDWNCPRCRDVCNCSSCMKYKGYRATGQLAHAAKQIGFRSVHELLDHHKGSGVQNSTDVAELRSAVPDSSPYKGLAASKRKRNKDKQCAKEENDKKEAGLHLNDESRNKKKKGPKRVKCNQTVQGGESVLGYDNIKPHLELYKPEELPTEAPDESSEEDIVLPQGNALMEVAGLEFPPQDVGGAFQFLEFCNSFAKALDIEKGQPEQILQDLVRGRIGRRGLSSPVVRFNIKLLSLIEENITNGNWVQALGRRITTSHCLLDIPRHTFDKGVPGYDGLDQSLKLRLLNFLCDEILGTLKLRNWIEEVHGKFDEETKEIKEKVIAVRKQEKLLKQNLRDKIMQALVSRSGAPLALSEHDNVISEIRTQAEKEHVELLKTIENLPKKKERSEASGTKPILVLETGLAYWKLRSYKNNSNIILQDIGSWDSVGADDNWYFFNEEEEKKVENYICSARNTKRKQRERRRKVSSDDVKGVVEPDSASLTGVLQSCPALGKIDKVKEYTIFSYRILYLEGDHQLIDQGPNLISDYW